MTWGSAKPAALKDAHGVVGLLGLRALSAQLRAWVLERSVGLLRVRLQLQKSTRPLVVTSEKEKRHAAHMWGPSNLPEHTPRATAPSPSRAGSDRGAPKGGPGTVNPWGGAMGVRKSEVPSP